MSTPTAPAISSPATLLAEIPATLGFYPENSIILLCLGENDGTGRYPLGPDIRADITDAAALCAALIVADEEEDVYMVDDAVTTLLEAEALGVAGSSPVRHP